MTKTVWGAYSSDSRASLEQTLPAVMVGIDQHVGPRSRSEARSVTKVITAMVMVSVGKADLRPVAPPVASCHKNVLEVFLFFSFRNVGKVNQTLVKNNLKQNSLTIIACYNLMFISTQADMNILRRL